MSQKDKIEILFKRHYTKMHRLAMRILCDEDVAHDIVHDVFESLLIASLTDVPEQYLLRAVRSRCLNHLRNLSTRERIKGFYALDQQKISDEDWQDDEIIAQIQSIVAHNLTNACRRVVELRFIAGWSYKEIADSLGISEVAVYKHLRHAIDVLRQKLSQNG